jgi:hypothetical protein
MTSDPSIYLAASAQLTPNIDGFYERKLRTQLFHSPEIPLVHDQENLALRACTIHRT